MQDDCFQLVLFILAFLYVCLLEILPLNVYSHNIARFWIQWYFTL